MIELGERPLKFLSVRRALRLEMESNCSRRIVYVMEAEWQIDQPTRIRNNLINKIQSRKAWRVVI